MVEPAVALVLTGTALIINAAVNNNSVYMHIIGLEPRILREASLVNR
jgi:hypothetical protein